LLAAFEQFNHAIIAVKAHGFYEKIRAAEQAQIALVENK
jgi:hypothetical protein